MHWVVDDDAGYERALHRLIDLRFEAARCGTEPPVEAQEIEQAIYRRLRRRASESSERESPAVEAASRGVTPGWRSAPAGHDR